MLFLTQFLLVLFLPNLSKNKSLSLSKLLLLPALTQSLTSVCLLYSRHGRMLCTVVTLHVPQRPMREKSSPRVAEETKVQDMGGSPHNLQKLQMPWLLRQFQLRSRPIAELLPCPSFLVLAQLPWGSPQDGRAGEQEGGQESKESASLSEACSHLSFAPTTCILPELALIFFATYPFLTLHLDFPSFLS